MPNMIEEIERNRKFQTRIKQERQVLIGEFLEDLDFLERNGNADWNIRTKIRPKWEKKQGK